MATEARRGCGYRKVGGLYIVSGTNFDFCHRTPVKTPEIEFFRGYKEINPYHTIGGRCNKFHEIELRNGGANYHCYLCSICNPPDQDHMHGLMFVGEGYYTPESFMNEAVKLGVSKRISKIPENLVLGDSIIYVAYKYMKFPLKDNDGKIFAWESMPAIFMSFVPDRIEKIITESQSKNEELMKGLEEKGITPVIVPDNDPDHK